MMIMRSYATTLYVFALLLVTNSLTFALRIPNLRHGMRGSSEQHEKCSIFQDKANHGSVIIDDNGQFTVLIDSGRAPLV